MDLRDGPGEPSAGAARFHKSGAGGGPPLRLDRQTQTWVLAGPNDVIEFVNFRGEVGKKNGDGGGSARSSPLCP